MKFNRSSLILTIIGICLFAMALLATGFIVGRVTTSFSSTSFAAETGVTSDNFKPYIQAWNILNENYIDQPIDPKTLVQGSIRGMLDELGDPYTGYIDPESFAQQNASLNGEYTGIGAWVDTSGEDLVIISPMPGSPAEDAGIEPGDIVVGVDGEIMEGLDPSLILEKILGPENSVVNLIIEREGDEEFLQFELTRAVILLPSVNAELIEENVAYIQVVSFANNTFDDFSTSLQEMLNQGATDLIIDLRNNPGGLLDSAIDLTSLFIKDKVVLIEEWGDGTKTKYSTTKDMIAKDIPVYILVNQGTASASEITAGALQDYDRAILIGNQTFGKGLIQNWVPLNGENGAVRVTTARWLTPEGRQIQGEGLSPDYVVDYTLEDFDADFDPQLEKALELISYSN